MGGCQANNTDISRIERSICVRRFPTGDAPNGCRKRSESPLVERWGKAPYPKFLFLEMFGLILTTPFYLQSERAESAFISNTICTALKSCSRRRFFTFPHTSKNLPGISVGEVSFIQLELLTWQTPDQSPCQSPGSQPSRRTRCPHPHSGWR